MTHKPTTRLALMLACSAAIAAQAVADRKINDSLLPSTAYIAVKKTSGGLAGLGSGVLVDAKYRLVLTNQHVARHAVTDANGKKQLVVFFPVIENKRPRNTEGFYFANAGKYGIGAEVLAMDEKVDLALLKLERVPANLKAIKLAKDSAYQGDEIHSIGSPSASRALFVYTHGAVKSINRKRIFNGTITRDMMVCESQSPINPGDSGGPVVNENGELVAITQGWSPRARLVTYMIDVSELRGFLKRQASKVLKQPRITSVKTVSTSSGSKAANWKINAGDKLLTVTVPIDGKAHTVYVAKASESYKTMKVRRVWAHARTLTAKELATAAATLLTKNAKTKWGAWTIQPTSGGKFQLTYAGTVPVNAKEDELRSAVEFAARMAKSEAAKMVTLALN